MSSAPRFDIDLQDFTHDPYPTFAGLRAQYAIAYVPQLDSTLMTRRDDIVSCERNIAVFSSHQPNGLMNRLMGYNMMRKDGDAHMAERKVIFPAVSPKTVAGHWRVQFQAHADRILAGLAPAGRAELCASFALPFSAECLKCVTGLTNARYQDMDDWSQSMIDGIANYAGDPQVAAKCLRATAAIDAAIDDMIPVLRTRPNSSLLSVMLEAGLPIDSVRANIKLAISGGQNEPRHAILGSIWALLTHPEQLAMARAGEIGWLQVFEEYARWISPIGMSPRRVAKPWHYKGVTLDTEDRIFFMFGSANRDEAHFPDGDRFDATRDASKNIAVRCRPALLRWGLDLARDGRGHRVTQHLCASPRIGTRRHDAGPDHRLGLPWPAEFASDVDRVLRALMRPMQSCV